MLLVTAGKNRSLTVNGVTSSGGIDISAQRRIIYGRQAFQQFHGRLFLGMERVLEGFYRRDFLDRTSSVCICGLNHHIKSIQRSAGKCKKKSVASERALPGSALHRRGKNVDEGRGRLPVYRALYDVVANDDKGVKKVVQRRKKSRARAFVPRRDFLL
jgi:hypothetical protein